MAASGADGAEKGQLSICGNVKAEDYNLVASLTGILRLRIGLSSETQMSERRDGERPAKEGEEAQQTRTHEVVGELIWVGASKETGACRCTRKSGGGRPGPRQSLEVGPSPG
eukprot:2069721-Pyramimonas_sp.AAC.1